MATLGLKEMGQFLWEGREKGLPCWLSQFSKTRKTCFYYRYPVQIAGNLFSKQGLPCMPPVLPCKGLQCSTVNGDRWHKRGTTGVHLWRQYNAIICH